MFGDLTVDAGQGLQHGTGEGAAALAETLALVRTVHTAFKINVLHSAQLLARGQVLVNPLQAGKMV